MQIFQLDAFTHERFRGNPAAVMPMERFLSDSTLQAIAAENNLAETAFLVRDRGEYQLRWFTPTVEVPLCGHATLASAAVVMERLEPERDQVVFATASGALRVARKNSGYVMNFPVRSSEPADAPLGLGEALGVRPVEVLVNEFNYLVVLESARLVRDLAPDSAALARLDRDGVIITAPGDDSFDFVSRYFVVVCRLFADRIELEGTCVFYLEGEVKV